MFNFKTVAAGVLDALREFFGEIVHVVIDEVKTNDPHYTVLPHNTLTTVWTPASGKEIHLISFIISAEAAGYALIYDEGDVILRLEFNERRAVPVSIPMDLRFHTDHRLRAIFVGDTGTPNAYITAIGHEH